MITVGRLTLPGPKDPSFTRDGLSFTGLIWRESQAVTNARRLQILGMREQLVPVIWTPGEVAGFYRVTEAQCDPPYITAVRSAMRYTLQLEHVAAAPDFESLLVGGQVPNSHGIDGTPWHAIPVGADAYRASVDPASASDVTGADGVVPRWRFTTAPTWAHWTVAAADFYAGGCTVEVDGLAASDAGHPLDPDNWLLSNSLIRVSKGTTVNLDVEWFTGGAWRSKVFNVGVNAVKAWIVHCDPSRAAVAFRASDGEVCTVTLRRGARFVTVHRSVPSGTATFGVLPATIEAATAIDGGLRATADDAAGNRYLIATPHEHSTILGDGAVSVEDVAAATFHLGVEVGGSSATGDDTAESVVDQAMFHLEELVRPFQP